jgi:hypothetical protein
MVGVIAVGGPNLGFTGDGFDLTPLLIAALLLIIARLVADIRIGILAVVLALLAAPLLEAAADRIGYPTVAASVLLTAVLTARTQRRTPRI